MHFHVLLALSTTNQHQPTLNIEEAISLVGEEKLFSGSNANSKEQRES